MMRDARPPPPGSGSSAGGAGRSGRCPPTLVAVALLLVLTGALLKSDARQTLRLRAWVKTRPAGELANGTARGGGDGESYFLGDLLSGLGLLGDEEDVAGGDGKSAGGDGKSAGADALEEGADDAADSGAAAEEAGSTAAASAGDGASSDGGNAAAGGGKAAQLSPPPVVAEADIVDTGGEDAAEEEADEDDEDEEAQGGGSEAAPTVAPIAGKPAAAAAVPSTAARVPPAPAAGMGSQQPPTRPQGRRRRERGSAGGAGAAASGGGGGGGSEEPNMVVRAYRAQLRRLLALPPEQRRYLRVTPMSGWGNKIRALSSALKLALATDRICLVDARTMAPFYGPMFDLPFRPWFARHVPTLGGGKGKHGGAGGTGWPHIEMRSPVKRNRPAKCWAEKRSLSACVDMSAQVVSYASYYNMDGLIQDTPELRAGLEAKLGSPLPSHRAYDLASLPALLPRLSRRLARHVADTQAALRWGDYRLVVGLHMRVFVVRAPRSSEGWQGGDGCVKHMRSKANAQCSCSTPIAGLLAPPRERLPHRQWLVGVRIEARRAAAGGAARAAQRNTGVRRVGPARGSAHRQGGVSRRGGRRVRTIRDALRAHGDEEKLCGACDRDDGLVAAGRGRLAGGYGAVHILTDGGDAPRHPISAGKHETPRARQAWPSLAAAAKV